RLSSDLSAVGTVPRLRGPRPADPEPPHQRLQRRALHSEPGGGAPRTTEHPVRLSEDAQNVMLASGWKKTRISPTPESDCDSMCSMLLTVVVIARSEMVTMRPSTSFGESPVNCQMIEITGMLISGKMSTGVRAMGSTPPMAISVAITMKVYGRRRARRTIHIARPRALPFA